jgi:hypothetical protein
MSATYRLREIFFFGVAAAGVMFEFSRWPNAWPYSVVQMAH